MARGFTAASSEHLVAASSPITAPPFTMSIWAYLNDADNDYALFEISDASQTVQAHLSFRATNSDFLRFRASNGTNQNIFSTAAMTAATWHHCCGVATTAADRDVYLDGGNSANGTTSVTLSGIDQIVIGAEKDGGTTQQPLDGRLAEAALWDVALDADEVASLAKGFSPLLVRPASLVFYAPLLRDEDRDVVGGLSLTAF